MTSLRLTDEARRDLADIRAYTLGMHGRTQADRYMRVLREGLKTLRQHPAIGYPVEDIHPGYRCYQISFHRVFYKIFDDAIAVVAILHQSQLPESQFEERGFTDPNSPPEKDQT